MVDRRQTKRIIKRCRVPFRCEGKEFSGISSNISERGIFIKTNRRFKAGSPIELNIEMDKDHVTSMKGRVTRVTVASKFFDLYRVSRNGIGIELTETTPAYRIFCEKLLKDRL